MSDVVTGVLAKVKADMPDLIGTNLRWSDALVTELIIAADRATRDKCEVHFAAQTITLADDTITYDLSQNFISIEKVEFALDGANYDWSLKSMSMSDLDSISRSWRTQRSARPDVYTLLSTPGVQDNGDGVVPSQIIIYPAMTTAGSATLLVTGVMVPAVGAYVADLVTPLPAAVMPEDVQAKCHVPFVKAILYAVESPTRAAEEWQNFLKGCEAERNRFRSQFTEFPARMGG